MSDGSHVNSNRKRADNRGKGRVFSHLVFLHNFPGCQRLGKIFAHTHTERFIWPLRRSALLLGALFSQEVFTRPGAHTAAETVISLQAKHRFWSLDNAKKDRCGNLIHVPPSQQGFCLAAVPSAAELAAGADLVALPLTGPGVGERLGATAPRPKHFPFQNPANLTASGAARAANRRGGAIKKE